MFDGYFYDGNHINGIIDLTDKGIGVRQTFLKWALQARWINYNIDEQKKVQYNLTNNLVIQIKQQNYGNKSIH